MLKVIIVDGRRNFLDDIEARLVLQDDIPFELVTKLNSPDNLYKAVNTFQPDLIAVADNVLDMQDDWAYEGTNVVAYMTMNDGEEIIKRAGLPSYGIVKNSMHLINLLKGPVPSKGAQKEEKEERIEDLPDRDAIDVFEEEIAPSNDTAVEDDEEYEIIKVPKKKIKENSISSDAVENALRSTPSRSRNPFQERMKEKMEEEKSNLKKNFEKEMGEASPDTMVVAVYAAKGGVGKTTIATSVATYLSLLPHGRGRYQVCIVDYNIDFGDVRSTLPFDYDGPGMYEWAMDIRDRMEQGEAPSEITYTRAEMNEYLLEMSKTGLFGLCAPTRHEESMELRYDELEIMLTNLKKYGGFDFIVCDTGNNTRDSSVLALSMADYILLVATQDATTAICNRSAQEALEKFGDIDMKKIRLVLNNVLPARETGVSCQDVEDEFDFPCIARIKHNTDVIRANNNSEPIVYQGAHPVTKELRNIVMFLTGKEEEPIQEKPNFFKKLFRR